MDDITTPAPLNAAEKSRKDADGEINEQNNTGCNAVGRRKASWDEVSEASVARLKSISKKEMTEVISYGTPPQQVKTLFHAALICLKLDKDPATKRDPWHFVRKHLLSYGSGQLGKFGDFDCNTVDGDMMKKLATIIEENEKVFDVEKMSNVSKACAGACMWVNSVYEYGGKMADVEGC